MRHSTVEVLDNRDSVGKSMLVVLLNYCVLLLLKQYQILTKIMAFQNMLFNQTSHRIVFR